MIQFPEKSKLYKQVLLFYWMFYSVLNLKLAMRNMCNRFSILRILKTDYANLKSIFNYLLA